MSIETGSQQNSNNMESLKSFGSSEQPTDLSTPSQPQKSPQSETIINNNVNNNDCIEGDDTGNDSNNNSKNSGCKNNVDENNGSNNNSQQFCLRWNNYQSNLTCVFDQLLQSESFVDVTLACDGNSIKAHKMVLSACSPYFQALFFDNPCQHPIVIMRDVKWSELKAAVEFMYKGEINVSQEEIGPLLKIADMLQIRGLAEVSCDRKIDTNLNSFVKIKRPSDFSNTIENEENSKKSIADDREKMNSDIEKIEKEKELLEQEKFDESKKPRLTPRDWKSMTSPHSLTPPHTKHSRKRQWPSGDRRSDSAISHSDVNENTSPIPMTPNSLPSTSATPVSPFPLTSSIDSLAFQQLSMPHAEDMEIKPAIAEMIREEERAKLLENSQAWLGAPSSTLAAGNYQYQLQSMWQKCWNSQNLANHLRFRERGPLKSWRPETMAEAIFSVLKEGLSLSQAARKYDIPYPTFVLYANRVHNMLGPSIDGGTDLRPKGRGRPQRILLGIWPDEHIKDVIRSVVFREVKEFKDEQLLYGRQSPFPFPDGHLGFAPNGLPSHATGPDSLSQDAMAAAALALRQQMCNIADVANLANFNVPPHMTNPAGRNLGDNQKRNLSPSEMLRGIPPELSLHGINMDLTLELENQKKRNLKDRAKEERQSEKYKDDDHRSRHSVSLNGHSHSRPEHYSSKDFCQNLSLSHLDNSSLSITRLISPTTSPDHNSISPSDIGLSIGSQSMELSYKSRENDFLMSSGRSNRLGNDIKMEPLTECRD